ncbi:DUF4179 domain-containing protein [Clostridium neuense]|uniref:DUF4179 domain-containing protein n=1 Tax=Clostridium neuense TaxID=1728934 RepID=A0ABW8TET3_9CLOT
MNSYKNVNLEEFNSIDIEFSKKEKEQLKKRLRKKIVKEKSKRNVFAAAVAVLLISAMLVPNVRKVCADAIPTFNNLYETLGFKSEYLDQSVYIGKTYEENGIKITLDNLIGTKHLVKATLKIQYSDKWSESKRPLIFFDSGFNGEMSTGSTGGYKDTDKNTTIRVIDLMQDKEFKRKGDFTIKAFSDAFKKTMTWNMKVDFSKNFDAAIEKDVTMSKALEANIKHIEINKNVVAISSDNWLTSVSNGKSYCLKMDNKLYPIIGASIGDEKCTKLTFMENMDYNAVKNSKNISLVEYQNKDVYDKMTKTEMDKLADEQQKELDKLPKEEKVGVTYTKNVTFKNGNKAEIYKIERKRNKLYVYFKGNDKKQLFNMLLNYGLYTSSGSLVQSIEETNEGYIAEFNDVPKENVALKIQAGALELNGNYSENESRIILK